MHAPLSLGIVGLSNHAEIRFANHLSDTTFLDENNITFHSAYSRSKNRHSAFSEMFDMTKSDHAVSLDAFLDDPDLDGVIITSATAHHARDVRNALERGKHVLVEKPLCVTISDARELVALADEKNLTLAVAYHMRHHAGHQKVYDTLQAGTIGTITSFEASWSRIADDAYTWRSEKDNGPWWALSSMGTHLLDLMMWFMKPHCGNISHLTSHTTTGRLQNICEEEVSVNCVFANGAKGKVTTSFNQELPRRIVLTGNKGQIVMNGTFTALGDGEITRDGQQLPYIISDPYKNEVIDFIDAIRQGRSPIASGEDGLVNVVLLNEVRGPDEPGEVFKDTTYST